MNLYRYMQYDIAYKGDIVFNYGDKGNLFYIILSGQIEVWTP